MDNNKPLIQSTITIFCSLEPSEIELNMDQSCKNSEIIQNNNKILLILVFPIFQMTDRLYYDFIYLGSL